MPRCFRCGALFTPAIRAPRRSVKTGSHVVRRTKSGKAVQVKVLYGTRVVCPPCARELDRQRVLEEIRSYPELLVGAFVLLAAIVAWVVS